MLFSSQLVPLKDADQFREAIPAERRNARVRRGGLRSLAETQALKPQLEGTGKGFLIDPDQESVEKWD